MALIKILTPFLLVAFSIGTHNVYGQTGKIRGQVVDAQTEETLAGVDISVQGTKMKVLTDMDGNFTINIKPGIYKVEASLISYETIVSGTIEVKNNEPDEIKIKLNPVNVVNSKEAGSIILKQLLTENTDSGRG